MKKQTLKQKALEFLTSKGWVEEQNSRVTKYLALTKPGVPYRYFLGNAGAVRRGTTVAGSISTKLNYNAVDRQPHQVLGAKQPNVKTVGGRMRRVESQQIPGTNFVMAADPVAEVEQRPDPSVAASTAALPSTPTVTALVAASQPSQLASMLTAATAQDHLPHVEVQALAGTGKTTTMIEGLKIAKGITPLIQPSEQQAAVWEQIKAGKHGSVRVSSFSTKITDELKNRCNAYGLDRVGVEARGIHSLGVQAVRQRFGNVSPDKAKWVVADIAAELLGTTTKDARGTKTMDAIWAVDSLVSLCKQTLTDPTPEALDELTSHYDVELNGQRDKVYGLVPQALERCKRPKDGRWITFDDMIWLPLVHDLPIFKVDLQIVDEAQDLNRMQQELMYRAGHRIIFVGDEHQAIYGFAGADAESMRRMRQKLNMDSHPQKFDNFRGCVTLPLTVTRRCCKAVVQHAQQWVPGFTAHESNPDGALTDAGYEETSSRQYRKLAQAGDLVLCRVNAPLVSQCFRFLKANRKAVILGRKIGEGLAALLDKSKASRTVDLIPWLGDWLAKEQANENAKKHPSEGRLDNLQDKHDCLLAFCEGRSEVAEVKAKIDEVFTDNKSDGVTLSSIHKAKGLEADRVFILQPKGVGPRRDKMQRWELEQEANLDYVAATRAKLELCYVR